MEFSRVSKKQHMEFLGLIKNEVEFPGVIKKKSCGISRGLGFFSSEFPRDVKQIGNTIQWNFQGWSFALSRISKGKVKKRKITGFFLNKYALNPPSPPSLFVFFSGMAQYNLHFNMSFKVSPKAKVSINGGFIFQFHDSIHLKILPRILPLNQVQNTLLSRPGTHS